MQQNIYCQPIFQQLLFHYNRALIHKTTQHIGPIQMATQHLDIATLVTHLC